MAPSKPADKIRKSIAAAVEFGEEYPLTNSEREHFVVYENFPGNRDYTRYPDWSKGKKA